MAETATKLTNKVAWVDLATKDAEGSRAFYSGLFGWDAEVNPDPQYGGYSVAKSGGHDVAGIGPAMDPNPRPRGRSTSAATTCWTWRAGSPPRAAPS